MLIFGVITGMLPLFLILFIVATALAWRRPPNRYTTIAFLATDAALLVAALTFPDYGPARDNYDPFSSANEIVPLLRLVGDGFTHGNEIFIKVGGISVYACLFLVTVTLALVVVTRKGGHPENGREPE